MSDSPVVVVAIFEAAEGKLDELRAALVRAIPAVHAEEGCDLYAIHDAPDSKIFMIEKWTSAELLDQHGAGDAVRQLGGLVSGFTAGPVEVIRMFPIRAGSAEQGLL